MARQKKEKVDRNLTYNEIVKRLGEDEDVSFERIGDTIILRRREPEEEPEPRPEAPELEFGRELDEAEKKLLLVKREIEKRKVGKVVRKDYEELDAAFARMEEKLNVLEKELRGLRVELGYLRGVVYDKMKAEKVEEKVKEVAVGKEKQLQLVQDDIPEIKFEETRISGLGLLASTLSNIYNSLFLGSGKEEKDVYREFQRRLFLLVRSQPRSLDEIAEGTGENKANCLIWLTRMVDEGLLEEVKVSEDYKKRVYRIVWEKVQ